MISPSLSNDSGGFTTGRDRVKESTSINRFVSPANGGNSLVCASVLNNVDSGTINNAIEHLKRLGAKIEGNTLQEPINCGGLVLMAIPQQHFTELASALGVDIICTWSVGDKCIALIDEGLVKALGLVHEPVELTCPKLPCTVRVLAPEWRLIGDAKLAKVGDYYLLCYKNNCAKTDEQSLHGVLQGLGVPDSIAIEVEDLVLPNTPLGVFIGSFSDGFNEYPVYRTRDKLVVRATRVVYRDGEPVEEIREGVLYEGPLEAIIARDRLTNLVYYILKTKYQAYVGFDLGDVVDNAVERGDPGIANTRKEWVKAGLRLLFRRAFEKGVKVTNVYTGPYPDGWHDGIIDYPAVTWDCDPTVLEGLIDFVIKNYDANRRQALANVGLSLGAVYAPALKFHWGVFENKIVVNSGEPWLGKTTLMQAIMNALGIYGRIYGTDEPSRTTPRVRNLLTSSMAPVVFNDVDEQTFEALRNYGLASTTDAVVTGVQAASAGRGFREVFITVANAFIITNLKIGKIAEIMSGNTRRTAWMRRFLFITWEPQRLKPNVKVPSFNNHPGRLIGCLRELWNNEDVRRDLLNSSDYLELSAKATKYFFIRYGIEVTPIIEALIYTKNEYAKTIEEFEAATTPEREVIKNMENVAKNLGYVADAYGIITALVNNPIAFDAKITYSRKQVDLKEWEELAKALGRDPGRYPLTDDDRKRADRIDLLLDMLYGLYQRGLTRVVLFAKSQDGVVKWTPRTLFNAINSNYPDNSGKKRPGYSISLVELARQLLPTTLEEDEQGQGQGGQEQQGQ